MTYEGGVGREEEQLPALGEIGLCWEIASEEESIIVSNRLFTNIQKIVERQNEVMGVFLFWH